MNQKLRHGRFTSSEIWKLMTDGKTKGTFGKPALTYIKEKQAEKRLGRSLNTGGKSKDMIWGSFLEQRVHDLLPTSYELISDTTFIHSKYEFWAGSPDNINKENKIVSDIKCLQPKGFCEYVDGLNNGVEFFKNEFPDKYWQLVSNACILNSNGIEIKYIEPIVYMPYEDELHEIRLSAENTELDEPWKYRWIYESDKSELAYIPKDSKYSNLNIFTFELDQSDVKLLESKVIEAGLILNS